MSQNSIDRLHDGVQPWLQGADRSVTAMTAAIVAGLWTAVLPPKEKRIPERSPEDFKSDDE